MVGCPLIKAFSHWQRMHALAAMTGDVKLERALKCAAVHHKTEISEL